MKKEYPPKSIIILCILLISISSFLILPLLPNRIINDFRFTFKESDSFTTVSNINRISITGNSQFIQVATEMNWLGAGSSENPYIIQDFNLRSIRDYPAIELQDISVYFVISNCTITGGRIGIALYNSRNGVIINNTIYELTNLGIFLENVDDCGILQNIIHNCSTGIYLSNVQYTEISQNKLYFNSEGIECHESEGNRISDNLIYENRYGIGLWNSYQINITNNIIINSKGEENWWWGWWWSGGDAIRLYSSERNVIYNNSLENNGKDAIQLSDSYENFIVANSIIDNAEGGVELRTSERNIIDNNTIERNKRGISLDNSPSNSIVNNILIENGFVFQYGAYESLKQTQLVNNTINNKSLIFWGDVSNSVVPDAGEIILLGCSNITIENQNLIGASIGLTMYDCTNISVQNNSLSYNEESAILSTNLRNANVLSNNITNNGYGIKIESFDKLNIIDNIIENNYEKGIEISDNQISAEFNGHTYQLIQMDKTWVEAKQDCEALGGHLVTITSKEENTWVSALIEGHSSWIGLTDESNEGTWKWVTGEPFTYSNWHEWEPNDAGGEDYVEMTDGDKWNDLSSDHQLYYICEWNHSTNINSTNPTISRNIVKNNSDGIYLRNIISCEISDNIIEKNSLNGIVIDRSNDCNVTGNNLVLNGVGINSRTCIFNKISNNTLVGQGLYIEGHELLHYSHNTIENNSVNEKPLIYWINVSKKEIPTAGQIFLINCEDIIIDNQNLSSASIGLFAFECSNITLTNSEINKNVQSAIIFQKTDRGMIINNSFNFNRHAIDIEDIDEFEITNNIITNNSEGGITLRGSNDVGSQRIIRGNTVINSSNGIDISDSSDCTISNNVLINNSESGIEIRYCHNHIITNNRVEYSKGIEIDGSANNILINNSVIEDGFTIHGWEREHYIQGDVINNTVNAKPFIYWKGVEDKIIDTNAGQIFLYSGRNIEITNVTIDSLSQPIVIFSSYNIGINSSRFTNSHQTAIRIEASNIIEIEGNYISQNDKGIEIYESLNILIENNTISDHFSDGVYIENSDSCDIVRNKFINNFGDGLSLSGGTNAIRIEQNLVQNNSNGINSHSKESDILNNTIIQNKGRGITLGWDTEGVNLVNNMISYNYEAAIRIKDATSSNLLNNSISNNCLSSDSSSGAIELRRSNQLTLSYNHLRNNLGWAVYIEETSWSELDHNLIENN
ncbi:MAG: right-handed parallel beta-helix repeat-containing protein, partial [Candidatus Hodarchaeales archaeon]